MRGHYAFVSRWRIDAPPAQCWRVLSDALADGRAPWWPAVSFDPAPLAVGQRRALTVRSPLGYRLRVVVDVVEVAPVRRVEITASGDLRGQGLLEVSSPAPGTTVLSWTWRVAVQRRWMRWLSPLLRPVFRLAHHRVMVVGKRGIRRIAASASGPRNAGNPGESYEAGDRPR
ncbi:SRPBCC family protein [Microbacterium sp.]|uniref:SRPBCC family protein n=1 Tax=Microbacterium sp. TaxID=51671 RepID=UPI003A8688B3